MRSRDIRALAVDYDRTLTDMDLALVPAALDALARARRAGCKVIVVSGRGLNFLQGALGSAADAFVGENGAFLLHAGKARRVGPAIDIRSAFAELTVPLELGDALASADLSHEALLRDALSRAGVDGQLIRNRDRVMALPRGVDKAVGALAALDALGIAPEQAAAAGDGENDVVMLQAVGYGIAVANAVDELKAIADHVSPEEGGRGVAAWIERVWLPSLEASA